MSDLCSQVNEELAKAEIPLETFQAAAVRLLENGVLCDGESKRESELYQAAVKLQPLLGDYFEVLGCQLYRDELFDYFRLYPPGAVIPGVASSEERGGISQGLRSNFNAAEVAMLLTLRFLYDKAWQEGAQNDAGEVEIQFEALYTGQRSLMHRDPPTTLMERLSLFRRLKQLRVVRVESGEDDFDHPEKWLAIRPLIATLVRHDIVASLVAEQAEDEA